MFLKCAKSILTSPLAELINLSVQSGKYPSKLKHAKVIPVYKGDDETDPNNYRPISLLSVFNRIFEKIMYNRLKSYIEDNELLFEAQYGFREKFSTQHAILDIVNTVQTNMDKKMFTCGIFLDFKKHLILSITIFYLISCTIMGSEVLCMSGSRRIWLTEHKQRTLIMTIFHPRKTR